MKPTRKPQTHYVTNGYIHFSQDGDTLNYLVKQYLFKNKLIDKYKGVVQDQQMLNKLLACETMADVDKIHIPPIIEDEKLLSEVSKAVTDAKKQVKKTNTKLKRIADKLEKHSFEVVKH